MKNKKLSISLVINTKNESKNITKCINSAKDLCDEIIIADMNSTDDTVMKAKKLGARIIKVKDYGYVEPARQKAISKAKGDWILLLDADERLANNLKQVIKKVISDMDYEVVNIPRKNIIFGKWIKHSDYWPDYQTRLFKKGHVRWSEVIHQQPEFIGKVKVLSATEENSIIHYHYSAISQWLERTDRYAEKSNYFDLIDNIDLDLLERYMKGEFAYRYSIKEGYKDGVHGYVTSKLMEFYRFMEFLKYWEKNSFKELFSNSELREYASIVNQKNIEKAENHQLRHELATIKNSKLWKILNIYKNPRTAIPHYTEILSQKLFEKINRR